MNAREKENIAIEAQKQIEALRKIDIWKNIAVLVSTLGVAAAYAGLAGTSRNLFLGIPGVIIILFGAGSALLLNLGLRNGRRNVAKMLDVLDKKGELS